MIVSNIELEIEHLLTALDPHRMNDRRDSSLRYRCIRQMTALLTEYPRHVLDQVHPRWIQLRYRDLGIQYMPGHPFPDDPADRAALFGGWPVMSSCRRFRRFQMNSLPYLHWRVLERLHRWLTDHSPGITPAHCYCNAWRELPSNDARQSLEWLRFKLSPEHSREFCRLLPELAAMADCSVDVMLIHTICRSVEAGEFDV
ncbi:MAG TPA: hypothetical protein PLV45_11520 [bacterium]|nr:hypothetical protein [bacterium]